MLRNLKKVLVSGIGRSWLCSIKQVGVVYTLAKLDTSFGQLPDSASTYLHQNVLQPHLLSFPRTIDNVNVLHEDLGVPLPLHLAQSDEDLHLLLGQQRLLHVALQPPQQEGFEDSMKSCYQIVITKARVGVEPLIKILRAAEHLKYKMIR